MADFTYYIRERVNIDGKFKEASFTHMIRDVEYIDERTLQIQSGSTTELLNLANLPGAGTFISSSIKYARITNMSLNTSINLKISAKDV